MKRLGTALAVAALIVAIPVVCPSAFGQESGGSKDPTVQPAAVPSSRPTVYDKWPFDAKEASRRQAETAAALGVAKDLALELGGGVSMKLVLIPAGKFLMGSPATEKGRWRDDGPQHEVTLTKPFYMGACELTQEQYEQIVGTNPSFYNGKTNPVELVSWEEATAFCKKLSAKTGKRVRLPTEAEWEYACRAGSSTPFHMGETVSTSDANYDGDSTYGSGRKGVYRGKTVSVGSFKPNAFGLYDMHGNVWEWCQDWYGESYYGSSAKTDPKGPSSGRYRVLRGGAWYSNPALCRSANRYRYSPDVRNSYYGFRVVVLSSGVD